MKHLLKEPLLHFLLLGFGLFVLYGLINQNKDSENTIVIDTYDMDNLIASWEMQWKRLPTDQELKSLVEQNIRQEVFYQEALKMNLDHNDEIIKRRLAQKMQFLSNDLATFSEPDDSDLQAFFEEHASNYLTPYRYSFYQVVFSTDQRDDPWADAKKLLRELGQAAPEEMEGKGDPLPFPFLFEETSADVLNRQLGLKFSKAMEEVEPGQWTGPVPSGFGVHLVYVTMKEKPRKPDFNSIRNELIRDFEYENQQKVNEQIYQELKKKYTVEFDLDPEKFDLGFVEFLKGQNDL